MSHTVFTPGTIVAKEWLNDVDKVVYSGFLPINPSVAPFGSSAAIGGIVGATTFYIGANGQQDWAVSPTKAFTPSNDNLYDLGITGTNRLRSGFFGTSVVTPLVQATTGAALFLGGNAGAQWLISTGGNMLPTTDAISTLGGVGNRIVSVFTTIIDSGTTGSLSLKTNNGQTGVNIGNNGANANGFLFTPGVSGSGSSFLDNSNSFDTNVIFFLGSKGTGGLTVRTDVVGAAPTQFQVLHTAGATRNITVTGSNGGNPTISTTAGSLNIGTPVTGAITIKRKSADESVNNGGTGATLHNDTDLQFAIGANEEWVIEGVLNFGAAIGTTGFKVAATVPSGATMSLTGQRFADAADPGSVQAGQTQTSGTTILAQIPAVSNVMVKFQMWVLNGATPGTVNVQWAQNTASATNLTARKGSFLQSTRVA